MAAFFLSASPPRNVTIAARTVSGVVAAVAPLDAMITSEWPGTAKLRGDSG